MKRKVLIADDEILVRIGIKHSVDWEANGLEVIGEAADGKVCLELVLKYNPDLIILDINMPEIDGIQVLKELKKINFKGKVIVLTCYEELEYVKQALKNGASDYVFKTNIKENGLLNAIQEISFEANEMSAQENQEIVREMIEERDLIRIIEGYPYKEGATKLRPFNLFCIICMIGDIEKVEERYQNKGMELFYNALHTIIKQILSRHQECIFTQYKADTIVIFISMSKISGMQECILQIRQLVQHLFITLREYLAVDGTIGVSDVKFSIAAMKEAYDEAMHAISQRFISPQKDIFYFERAAKDSKDSAELLQKAEKKIRLAVFNKNYEILHEELAQYFETIRKGRINDSEKIKEFLSDVIKLVQSYEKDWNVEYEEKMYKQASLEEAEAVIYQFLNNYISVTENNEGNYIIRRAEEYIRENYAKKISLYEIANYLELSESYTSRLFNKYKGRNIPTYINELRIEKAKKFLKETNMKIYEIASKVGFVSNTAFYIAFKKSEGISPIEFRNLIHDK